MRTKYERTTYQFLSAYRFLSYGLAILLTQVGTDARSGASLPLQTYLVVIALGVYTLARVFSPLSWRDRGAGAYAVLIGEFVMCLSLVVMTGGLQSSFLLYLLTPIITAALFFDDRISVSLALIGSMTLAVTQLGLPASGFAPPLESPTLLIIFALFSLVVAYAPSRVNLNVRRRIERDAIIEERRRLGREIHDGVAQSLGFLNIMSGSARSAILAQNPARALADLDEIQKATAGAYEDVREAVDQLNLPASAVPLIPALADYVKRFSQNTGVELRLSTPKSFAHLAPDAELQLMRIAQEALTNVRRHAKATRVDVSLQNTGTTVEMIVKDNGIGFAMADHDNPGPGHYGLSIIKQRAEGLGGSLTIYTGPRQGTELRVNLPFERVRL